MGLRSKILGLKINKDVIEIRQDINILRKDLLDSTKVSSQERNIVGQILHIANHVLDEFNTAETRRLDNQNTIKNRIAIKKYNKELKELATSHKKIDLHLMKELTKLDEVINKIYISIEDAEINLEKLAA